MSKGAVFPAFIRATFEETPDGVPAFERSILTSINKTRQAAKVSTDEMWRELHRAMHGRTLSDSVMRASAQAADERARVARQLATAIAATAAAEADYSLATQVAIANARQLADEEEHTARMANLAAAATERMATAARNANIDFDGLIATSAGATRATGVHRQAQMMLGQQLQDTAIQMQLGINPLMILTQQGSQAAFSLQQMGGRAATVGRFLSSPWLAALMVAGTGLTMLTSKSEETANALEQVKFSSDAVGDAQGILGNVMDITTGKITAQRNELIALAIAQSKVATLQAQARAAALRGEVEALQKPTTEFGANFGGGIGIRRVDAGARGAISKDFLAGELDTKTAVQRLDNLRRAGVLTDEAFAEAAKSVSSLGIELANIKTFEAADRLLNGLGTGADKGRLLKPSKPDRAAGSKASALAEFGEDAAERIKRINETFDEQPRLVDRAAQATRELDSIMADLAARKPEGYEALIEQAKAAKIVVEDGLLRPFNELIDRQQEQLTIGDLVIRGRESEADALRDILGIQRIMGPLDEQRRQAIIDGVRALEQQNREMDKLEARRQPYLNANASLRGNIRDSIAGLRTEGIGAVGGLVKSVRQTFDNLTADVLTEKLFGDVFRGLDEEIRAANGIKTSSEIVNDALAKLAKETSSTADAMAQAVATINGTPAANDNGSGTGTDGAATDAADIVVTASKAMMEPGRHMANTLTKGLGIVLPDKIADKLGKFFGENALQGAAYGQMAGGLVYGNRNSALGASIGGAIGNTIGEKFLTKGFTDIAKGLGDFAGPFGSIVGGLLGGALGGLLGKTPRASAQIGGDNGGELRILDVSGNNKSGARAGALDSGTDVIQAINDIASALGGSVDASRGSVSIGVSGDSWHVDTTGRGRLKKSQGGHDFNQDYEAAVAFATMDLIKDGVIVGLRASTQRLLQSAKDVTSGLQKAMDFESVFKSLKAYDDPVGAALGELDSKFKRLQSVFKEAGASTAEYAELERLYGIERADAVKEAGEQITSTLRSLMDDLTVNNDARSLRARKGEAQAEYDSLAAKVRAGDKSAYDDFAEVARTLLDIERQISGSGEGYFNLLDQVTELTRTRIDAETNVIDLSAGRDSLFSTSLAPVVSATETQTALINAVSRENAAGVVAAVNLNTAALNEIARRLNVSPGSVSANSVTALLLNGSNF